MTVILTAGNLFDAKVDCLVNPVNCVGVMGAGLAKQFAVRWPDMLADYRSACRNGSCQVGRVHLWRAPDGLRVAQLPTKIHWRDPSHLDYIKTGLDSLAEELQRHDIRSVAMPALGCGLGGLPWEPVKNLIMNQFGASRIRVLLFVPAGLASA